MGSNNIHPIFDRLIQRADREQFLNQRSKVFWFSGLSGSGKSTIAQALERKLFNEGFFAQVLDGDNTRTGINANLGFTLEDRNENIRRVAEITKLYLNSGIICLNSFITPTNELRDLAKNIVGAEDFFEIFINTPIEICEQRDVKGLYQKARKGEIKGFTGIDSPFELPQSPDLEIKTENQSVEKSVETALDFILNYVKL